ncbi:MAG: hypothetical protein IIB99_13210, partial [Planctomycetes bacterium]|nr:hypothetical protein [Planctomycetota bacterium]
LARATGGSVSWNAQCLPDFRRVKPGRGARGDQWAGLVRNGAYVVIGVRQVSLLPPLLLLLLGAGGTAQAFIVALADAGFEVYCWNRTREKIDAVVEQRAHGSFGSVGSTVRI